MTINWTAIESALGNAAGLVKELAPLAAAGGPMAGTIGSVVGAAAGFAQEALTAAQAEGSVIDDTTLAQVQAAQASIQATNDAVAAQIAAS